SRPKNFEQLVVRDFLRVERDLDDFSMARVPGADLLVTGLVLFPSRVTAGHRLDAVEPFEHRFHAPEATAAKRGQFRCVGRVHFFVGWLTSAGDRDAQSEHQPNSLFHASHGLSNLEAASLQTKSALF